jgi:hypothetical protein
LLKHHRIRRVNAEGVLQTLRQPAIKVPDGVAEAASIHIHSLIVRIRVVNRELSDAEHKLDELCTAIGKTDVALGERAEHHDVAILRSLPGIGRINLATLLSEASGPLSRRDYQALRTLSGVAPVTKRSGKSHVVVMRYASHVRLRNTVYHWARVATQHDDKSRTRYAALRRRGHSHGRLSAALQIDSLQWHVSSCSDRLCSTHTSARAPLHKAILVFDHDNRCSSVRPQSRSSVPTCQTALRPRTAAVKTGRRPPAQPAQRGLDGREHGANLIKSVRNPKHEYPVRAL